MSYGIKNCIWNDAEHTSFDCVWTHPELGDIPFTASPDDPDATGKALFAWAREHAEIAEPNPAKLFAEAKTAAIANVSAAAAEAKSADIDYQGVSYQADARAEKALSDRIAILQASGNTKAMTTWIAADNSQHDLSFADLAALAYAIAERKQRIVLRAREKKDAIAKAKTVKAVEKINLAL